MRYLLLCIGYIIVFLCTSCDGSQTRPGPLKHRKTSLVPMQGLFTGERGCFEIAFSKSAASDTPEKASEPGKTTGTP